MTPPTRKTPPAGLPDWRSPIFRLLICLALAAPGLAVALTMSAARAADLSVGVRLIDQAAGAPPPQR